jgi:hypothetical protein
MLIKYLLPILENRKRLVKSLRWSRYLSLFGKARLVGRRRTLHSYKGVRMNRVIFLTMATLAAVTLVGTGCGAMDNGSSPSGDVGNNTLFQHPSYLNLQNA